MARVMAPRKVVSLGPRASVNKPMGIPDAYIPRLPAAPWNRCMSIYSVTEGDEAAHTMKLLAVDEIFMRRAN
jgi:hypothetical protein